MTNKKVELQEENLENVNGGVDPVTVITVGKTIYDVVKGSGGKKTSAPTNDKSVKNNKAGGNQNINSGEFTKNKNSKFGGGSN